MKQLIDQSAHFTAALAVVLLSSTSTLLPGIIIGLALGLVREITEDGSVLSKGSLTDITFWTLGGAVGTLLI